MSDRHFTKSSLKGVQKQDFVLKLTINGESIRKEVLFILAGIVLGGFLGDMLAPYSFWSWLSYGKTFGIETVTLNLSILTLTFGLQIKINIASILGIIAAVLIYRRI